MVNIIVADDKAMQEPTHLQTWQRSCLHGIFCCPHGKIKHFISVYELALHFYQKVIGLDNSLIDINFLFIAMLFILAKHGLWYMIIRCAQNYSHYLFIKPIRTWLYIHNGQNFSRTLQQDIFMLTYMTLDPMHYKDVFQVIVVRPYFLYSVYYEVISWWGSIFI